VKFGLPFKDYNSNSLRCDFIAALTVAVLIIPQGMAYSVLAGLPPIYGLYACLVPLLIYPFFGSSPFLSVGPVALVSVLLLGSLCLFAEPMSPEYIQLAIIVSLMAGIMQILLSVFKMGFLVNFLSHPVISGFTSAAAFIIIISQLKHFFGVELERSTGVMNNVTGLFQNIAKCDFSALSLSAGSLIGIIVLKKIWKPFPSALFFIILGSCAVYFLKLDTVNIIGEVPSGLPSFNIPMPTDFSIIPKLIPLSIVICLISFIESLAISKSLSAKHDGYPIDPDQELLALGLAKVGGAFFQAFPNTGSFSRSAINESSGAKSGWSSIIAALLIALSVLFLTKLFYYIPYPVLAGIIIAAVMHLIDIKTAKHLYHSDRNDFYVLASTFFFTLGLGVQLGIIIGIILSMLIIIKRTARPHTAVLGKIDDDGNYRNIERFNKAETDEDILILRYDDEIFFGNAEHFFNTVLAEFRSRPEVETIVLDLSSVSNIDSTGIIQFKILVELLHKNHIDLHLSGLKGPVRDRLQLEGIYEMVGLDNIHLSIEHTMEKVD